MPFNCERHTVKEYVLREFIANKCRFIFNNPKLICIDGNPFDCSRIERTRVKLDYEPWYHYNTEVIMWYTEFTKEIDHGGGIIEKASFNINFHPRWMGRLSQYTQIYDIKTAMDFISLFITLSIKLRISLNGATAMYLDEAPKEWLDREIKRVEFRKTMIKIIV